MRGLGRTFKHGSVWCIADYHRAENVENSRLRERESGPQTTEERRLGEITAGKYIHDEGKLTFEQWSKV